MGAKKSGVKSIPTAKSKAKKNAAAPKKPFVEWKVHNPARSKFTVAQDAAMKELHNSTKGESSPESRAMLAKSFGMVKERGKKSRVDIRMEDAKRTPTSEKAKKNPSTSDVVEKAFDIDSINEKFQSLLKGQGVLDKKQKALDKKQKALEKGQGVLDKKQKALDKGQKALEKGQKTVGQKMAELKEMIDAAKGN